MEITEVKLTNFSLDEHNANKGTERGQKMIEDSLQEDGAARSVVVDKNDNVVAGNKTLEAAASVGIDRAIVVEVSGNELIVTKRIDWDLYEDEAPRRYAYRDNRAGETDLEWAPDQVIADLESGIDLTGLFSDNELAEIEEEFLLSSELANALLDGVTPSNERKLGEKKKQIKPVLYVDEIATFEAAIKAAGIKNRGQALIEICKEYLEKRERQLDF